jgi:hypothetical protein
LVRRFAKPWSDAEESKLRAMLPTYMLRAMVTRYAEADDTDTFALARV